MIRSSIRPRDRPSDGATAPRRVPEHSRAMRLLALFVTFVVDAVAFATILRPRHGYTSGPTFLAALADGVGAALGALGLAAAAIALARRREPSVWRVVTAAPTLGTIVAVFVIAAAGSQLAPTLLPPSGPPAARAARGDFQRWQAAVVPIAVRWMHAVRIARRFERGIPARGLIGLRRKVIDAERTLDQLGRTLAAEAPSLPQRPRLRKLTIELQTAVAFARRAQHYYVLSLTPGARPTPRHSQGRVAGPRALVDLGNAAIRESLSIMTTFSLQANGFGTSLFAGPG